jgi:hypothetical protein
MAAVSPKQTGVKLMNQLPRGAGQIAAALQQLSPKTFRSGPQRYPAKSAAHLPHQGWQMRFKALPISIKGHAPMLNLPFLGLSAEPSLYCRGIDGPIRLGEEGQATHSRSPGICDIENAAPK